ncbi:uncharacterized protein N7482_001571 [Penicillium canariense]|uniref:Uncharacterized protein n=1 Tax=Penicillium canariense TaxID=189055 RepID=A0A9W9IG72_9EURO|nr:uncharacterized protein N7482_001571 [Penicillium canariense]KAJ5175694.1 hypothetical protein N7482_001571 [Penicillium canariense]
MPPSTEPTDAATSGGRDETSTPKARPEATPANPAVADANADRERRRERKRQARRRREEAGYILEDLRSGERILYLQEVPRVKASHCRAWDCAITRLARSPIIRSQYRFALKSSRNMYYGEELIEYYHITCIERLIPNLAELVVNGHLKLDGWVSAPLGSSISIESSTQAITDWFEHGGRTFDIQCYERFKADHKEWTGEISFRNIEHQLGHEDGRSRVDCYYCEGGPAEPREPVRSDYFPTEPAAISLSRLLAVVSDEPHIDAWWCWGRAKKGSETKRNAGVPQEASQ